MRWLQGSYAAKLFTGLLGTVGALLLVTLGVVRAETGRQVQIAAERAIQNAASQLVQVEEIRQQEVARAARPFTEGRRMLAQVESALESREMADFALDVEYEVQLARLDHALLVFTDARGRPLLTFHGTPMAGEDPARLEGPARGVLEGEAPEVRSYRVVEGTLFAVRTQPIQSVSGRVIGTIALGAPVLDEEVGRVGEALGVEVCVVVEGACVAGTPTARQRLADRLALLAGTEEAREVTALGATWSVRSQALVEGDPGQGARVIAVPLDPVLAPFQRITRALLLSGVLALLLAVVVAMVLSRGLTRPVRALVSATARVADGDYEAEVPVTTSDEMGTLAVAFNDMTRGLLLKERLRSILDVVSSREVAEELVRGGLELGGENREVTVLFADIRGFSALTEGMEPQRVIAFLNECMQRLSDAVVAQGGHVDKFVGDELMAVFNAPREVEDHVGRALRAALDMQSAMAALNVEREARGEPAISLGVGVNTGVVVAGKMGSETRNNYTVLGDTVNLASRLCSGAGPGEILATRACIARAGGTVRAHPLGRRAFKGFSEEVEVMTLHGLDDAPGPVRRGRGGVGTALGLVVLALAPLDAAAQGLPTLRDHGGEWVSASGQVQVTLSGQLDLEALAFSAAGFGLASGGREDVLMAPRLRLFADVFVGDRVYGLVEVRGDRGDAPRAGEWDARVEQAWVRVALGSAGAASLQVGRFASPFGSYAARHLGEVDPFIRPPLFHDYRTTMCPGIAPPDAGGFLTWKDRPQEFRGLGAPPVWGVPYAWGAMVAGVLGGISYRLAAMNSAPSSDPAEWGWDAERMRHPSWVAGLGVPLSPGLSLGASFNRGPWLEELKRGTLPQGRDRWDYLQTLVAVDLTYARGPVMVRLEGVRDQWDVPNMATSPVELGGSVEVQADLAAGLFAAARFGFLDFRTVEEGTPGTDWDHDARRYEASAGYRLDRNAGLLLSWGTTPARSTLEGRESLLAARLWWAF